MEAYTGALKHEFILRKRKKGWGLCGIPAFNMSGCKQATITDAAFAHLRGIYALDMRGCLPAIISAAMALGLHPKQ